MEVTTTSVSSHHNITQLITNNNITKVREMFNVDNNEDLIIAASSYKNVTAINVDLLARKLVISPGSVLIVRNADALLLLRLLSGIRNSFSVLIFAVLVAVLVSVLVWLTEHRHNDDFPNAFGKGLCVSFWFTMVIMTTVGYGDKAPKVWLTRIICIFWMVFSVLVVAMVTASIMEEVDKGIAVTDKYVAVLRDSAEQADAKKRIHAQYLSYNTYVDVMNAIKYNDSLTAAFVDQNVAAWLFYYDNYPELKIQKSVSNKNPINMFISYGKKNKTAYGKKECSCCKKIRSYLYYGNYSFQNKNFPINYERIDSDAVHMIPPLSLTKFYVREFGNMFDDSDHGLMKYTFAVACVFIFSALITELFLFLQNRRRMKQQNDATIKTNSLDVSFEGEEYRNITRQQVEKKIIEALDDLCSE